MFSLVTFLSLSLLTISILVLSETRTVYGLVNNGTWPWRLSARSKHVHL